MMAEAVASGAGGGSFLQVVGPVVWTAVGTILLAMLAWVFRKWSKEQVYQDFMQALDQSVNLVQEQYVDWWKKASADGQLSKDERRAAAKLAWDTCLKTVRDPRVIAFASTVSWDTAQALITGLVQKKRSGTVTVLVPTNGGLANELTAGGVPGVAGAGTAGQTAESGGQS